MFHCLLIFTFSSEMSEIIQTVFPLYIMCSLATFKIFSLLLIFRMISLILVLLWVHWASWFFKCIAFTKFEEILGIIYSNIPPVLFYFSLHYWITIVHIFKLFILSHRCLVQFFHFFFPVSNRLDAFYWYIFKFKDSFLYYLHYVFTTI